jgi:hypothetical protein
VCVCVCVCVCVFVFVCVCEIVSVCAWIRACMCVCYQDFTLKTAGTKAEKLSQHRVYFYYLFVRVHMNWFVIIYTLFKLLLLLLTECACIQSEYDLLTHSLQFEPNITIILNIISFDFLNCVFFIQPNPSPRPCLCLTQPSPFMSCLWELSHTLPAHSTSQHNGCLLRPFSCDNKPKVSIQHYL